MQSAGWISSPNRLSDQTVRKACKNDSPMIWRWPLKAAALALSLEGRVAPRHSVWHGVPNPSGYLWWVPLGNVQNESRNRWICWLLVNRLAGSVKQFRWEDPWRAMTFVNLSFTSIVVSDHGETSLADKRVLPHQTRVGPSWYAFSLLLMYIGSVVLQPSTSY